MGGQNSILRTVWQSLFRAVVYHAVDGSGLGSELPALLRCMLLHLQAMPTSIVLLVVSEWIEAAGTITKMPEMF